MYPTQILRQPFCKKKFQKSLKETLGSTQPKSLGAGAVSYALGKYMVLIEMMHV
jgi:hypothetical protein